MKVQGNIINTILNLEGTTAKNGQNNMYHICVPGTI